MKKILLFIITLLFMMINGIALAAEPSKVMSLDYDDSSSLIFLNIIDNDSSSAEPIKIVNLQNPNRIYFDITNSVLIGEKKQLIFDKSPIKEIRVAQFSTNPDVVRVVISFEEDFDINKVKISKLNSNIIVDLGNLLLKNDYFNPIYDEAAQAMVYSNIVVNSQVVQKVALPPQSSNIKVPENVIEDITQAFQNSTLNNTDGKVYDSVVSLDLSSNLKLRTKYFVNGCFLKNSGLLISGFGQITANKLFYLDSPSRLVIDLANTFVDKKIRNKEVLLCSDGSCKDKAKIGQFEYNKARVVITSDKPDKYIPIYSADAQSMLLINADKLHHTELVNSVSNLNKAYVKRIDAKTNEVILSFSTPVVSSILRTNENLTLYLFNVKNYNEPDLIKTFNNTYYKDLTFALLPQIGVKASIKLNKEDIVKIEQGMDGKAIKLTVKSVDTVPVKPIINKDEKSVKTATKNKVVLDAGHGGSDYGAIREGINEKDITLDVTQRIASILKSKGFKVILTRTDDKYVSLEDRVTISENESPEIFVSVHVNSAVSTEPNGIETHYYHDYSKDLATTVHNHLIKAIDTKNRGLFKSKFYVINHTTVPAILVEIGFISNSDERADLITDKRKQKTAKAIAEGIIEYCKFAK